MTKTFTVRSEGKDKGAWRTTRLQAKDAKAAMAIVHAMNMHLVDQDVAEEYHVVKVKRERRWYQFWLR
jgi:hypothetical protein